MTTMALSEHDARLAEDLAQSLAATTKLLSALTTEMGRNAGTLAVVSEQTTDIVRAVRGDGNGERGLLMRVTVLERALAGIEKAVEAVQVRCNTVQDRKEQAHARKADSAQNHRWKLIVALVGGSSVLSIVADRVLGWLFSPAGGK